jgi:hypothetical protein
VAKAAVDLVRGEGFKVWHGTLDTMPEDFVQPDAIVSLFMIHHLDDPMGFFRILHGRYPDAPLALAEYGIGKLTSASYPPRTLTHWNVNSLKTALDLAGYDSVGRGVRSTGSETTAIALLRKTLRGPMARNASIYRFGRRIQRRVLPKLMKPFQQKDFTVVAMGTPRASVMHEVRSSKVAVS